MEEEDLSVLLFYKSLMSYTFSIFSFSIVDLNMRLWDSKFVVYYWSLFSNF